MRTILEAVEKFAHGPDRRFFIVREGAQTIGRFDDRRDAELFMAAPDLLAACEYVEQFCAIGRSGNEMATLGKRLRGAIGKAKGAA